MAKGRVLLKMYFGFDLTTLANMTYLWDHLGGVGVNVENFDIHLT